MKALFFCRVAFAGAALLVCSSFLQVMADEGKRPLRIATFDSSAFDYSLTLNVCERVMKQAALTERRAKKFSAGEA